jgi:Fe-S cluster assembly protein SufD
MDNLIEAIAGVAASLPAPGRLSEQRSAALAAFRQQGFPSRATEQWRYTDISKLQNADLSFETPPASVIQGFRPLLEEGDRIVLVNGVLDPGLSRYDTHHGAEVSVLDHDWNALSGGFPRFEDILDHPLGSLNTATAQHGVVIRLPAGCSVEPVVTIVLAHSGNAPLALQPRIVLDLGENSSLRVVLHYVSDSATSAWTNAVVEIRQSSGASLELIQLQEQSTAHTQTSLISAALEHGSSTTIGCFDLGASLARNDIDIRLQGSGASARVYGAFLPINHQHIDTHVSIDHRSPETQSETNFRGIAGKRSRGVFNGKVIVRADAQRISAQQRSDNLLLAEDAEIDTKPELEIYADDVRCSHGATIGDLDEQHLFYLRSRGIDDVAARALLTFAFARTIVEHIGDERLRSIVGERIAQRLPQHERWEKLI